MHHELQCGIELLNSREFFAAHEVLEDVWRAAPAVTKAAYQGLVQVAVAMHHVSTGNLSGGRSVLAKAIRNLSEGGASMDGIDVDHLREQLARWQDALEHETERPAWPTVRWTSDQAQRPQC